MSNNNFMDILSEYIKHENKNSFRLPIAKFSKVSYEQFKKDWIDTFPNCQSVIDRGENLDKYIKNIYDNIKLPKRATSGSAGYDFYIPTNMFIRNGFDVKIPTGIRCEIDSSWVLMIYPRSGHGFKTGIHLANTVGVIDSDYYHANNEGHIFVKLVNDSSIAKDIELHSGDAFCQGVFVQYGIAEGDDTNETRTGGFGSTDKESK